jgi:phosphoribosylglycinamide formyltransferase 2
MTFTTPLQQNATKIMLLGSGELGKEVAIEAQRLGIEVVAVDKYDHAPAHLVANRSYAIDMQDEAAVLEVIEKERPTYILPEVEAISISALFEAEKRGFHVIPNAEAVNKTMNRKNIRVFAAEELGLKTSAYRFVKTEDELKAAADALGYPCVVKPVMSSSGHGQSIVRTPEDIARAFEIAQEARGDASELIVEEFIPFDYEITLLTVRNETGTLFCDPIGHRQEEGDFVLSWQPKPMSDAALEKAKAIAKPSPTDWADGGFSAWSFSSKGTRSISPSLAPDLTIRGW